MKNITIEPGALSHIPLHALVQFLNSHGCELVANARGGMTVRSVRQPVDYAVADLPTKPEVTG